MSGISPADVRALARDARSALRQALPPGAFLRRRQKDGLFVTNACALADFADVAARVSAAGFRLCGTGSAAGLCAEGVWAERLERRYPEPPDFLCRSLARLAGLPPSQAALACLTAGLSLPDAPGAAALDAFERRVRETAALCLREHTGGAYACALLLWALRAPEHF